jgi:four helix bundle protein
MNIAEGCGRGSSPDLARFLRIAMGSASEVEYQLLLLNDLSMLSSAQAQEMESQLLEIKRMLNALIQRVSLASKTND